MKRLKTLAVATLLAMTACAQETIQLPRPNQGATNVTLMDALASRHSVRSFSSKALSLEQLSLLLWAADGINREDGRLTAPTAMNRQDIQLYVCRQDGAYLYHAKENSLERITTKDLRPSVAGDRQPFAKEAPISLLIVSDQRKFGRDSRDYGCMDAGYVSQNIYLAAAAMGLGTVARAMMDRDEIVQALGLVPEQLLLLNHPVGYVE